MKKLVLTLLSCSLIGGFSLNAQVNTFPSNEDFESELQGPTGCGPTFSTTSTLWSNGDDVTPVSTGHQVDWTADVNGTSSSGTGPSVDHTFGTTAGTYMYTESSCNGSGYPTRNFHLISTYYDFSALSAPSIEFWYHMFGTSMGMMHLDVDTTQGSGAWNLDVKQSFFMYILNQYV